MEKYKKVSVKETKHGNPFHLGGTLMQCRFSFKHMKTSEALINYAEAKITQKIEKFSTKPIEAHVTFSVEGHEHIAHCGVTGGDGFNFQVDSSCADMYGSVDLLLGKLEVQLKRQKEKLKKSSSTKSRWVLSIR